MLASLGGPTPTLHHTWAFVPQHVCLSFAHFPFKVHFSGLFVSPRLRFPHPGLRLHISSHVQLMARLRVCVHGTVSPDVVQWASFFFLGQKQTLTERAVIFPPAPFAC